MAITRTAITDDSGTGTDGTVLNNAWKTELYDQIDAMVGPWTAVTFSAGNFTASSGSWTVASGDVLVNRYQIINKTLFWYIQLVTTTVSATPASLRIAIPSGTFVSTGNFHRAAYVLDNGTVRECLIAPGDGTHLYISRSDAGNFAAATDATNVYFSAWFELA